MAQRSMNGVLEDFRLEFLDCWKRLPNKGFFLILLAAWLTLFQFLGNAAQGYIRTPSLMGWMWTCWSAKGVDGVAEEAHGKLIPVVVLVLFWWKRKELLAQELKLWWPGLFLVALGLLIHFVGYAAQQSRISIIGLFTGIYGLMGLAWGLGWLRRSFFPFFLLAFCVPLGNFMQPVTFRLRLLVSEVVQLGASFLSFDVMRQGTALINPVGHYRYEVAAACSGMHSLIATLAFAIIYGMLAFRRWWKIGLLIASAFPLAVLGNVVRMFTIIFAAELWGQEAGNYVHTGGPGGILSLLPYVPAFAGLLLIGHWLREPEPAPTAVPPADSAPTSVAAPVPAEEVKTP